MTQKASKKTITVKRCERPIDYPVLEDEPLFQHVFFQYKDKGKTKTIAYGVKKGKGSHIGPDHPKREKAKGSVTKCDIRNLDKKKFMDIVKKKDHLGLATKNDIEAFLDQRCQEWANKVEEVAKANPFKGSTYKGMYKQAYSKKDLKIMKPMLSWKKNKKMVVLAKKGNITKVVHFGQVGYEDFTMHRDINRRKKYLTRSAGIRNKYDKLTKDDPFSPNYWSRRILWDSEKSINTNPVKVSPPWALDEYIAAKEHQARTAVQFAHSLGAQATYKKVPEGYKVNVKWYLGKSNPPRCKKCKTTGGKYKYDGRSIAETGLCQSCLFQSRYGRKPGDTMKNPNALEPLKKYDYDYYGVIDSDKPVSRIQSMKDGEIILVASKKGFFYHILDDEGHLEEIWFKKVSYEDAKDLALKKWKWLSADKLQKMGFAERNPLTEKQKSQVKKFAEKIQESNPKDSLEYDDYKEAIEGEGWAIADYADMISRAETDKEKEVLTHIRNEEKEHLDELIGLLNLRCNCGGDIYHVGKASNNPPSKVFDLFMCEICGKTYRRNPKNTLHKKLPGKLEREEIRKDLLRGRHISSICKEYNNSGYNMKYIYEIVAPSAEFMIGDIVKAFDLSKSFPITEIIPDSTGREKYRYILSYGPDAYSASQLKLVSLGKMHKNPGLGFRDRIKKLVDETSPQRSYYHVKVGKKVLDWEAPSKVGILKKMNKKGDAWVKWKGQKKIVKTHVSKLLPGD